MKNWDDDFAGAIDDFLVDEPVSMTTAPRGPRQRPDGCCCSDPHPESGDLFALLAIPWTDQETTEFLRLVGIPEPNGN